MRISELFASVVTRDIPPVVYFHEQDPKRLQEEVSEYIITGGYPESDPRAQRLRHGIHEQFVRLLNAIAAELAKRDGPELPASWISGFYGSGKSSFAKLLGLSLDGRALPDGTSLSDALIRRDESPHAREFADAWAKLRAKVDPIGVVFDIGGVARNDEHIHAAVVRQIQLRLGYSPNSLVADYEIRLEQDKLWPQFVDAAERTLKRPWKTAKSEQLADEHMSHVMHVLYRDRYPDTMTWLDARAGAAHGLGTSVEEATKVIGWMLDKRAAGKTLFVVVDEVSQYVHQDDQRMLKLQSFVSELGQRLRGKVWLLATGQQKLEEESVSTTIGKLKERFPASLRVHLDPANIRDVVHRRLLKKAPEKEHVLRELFQQHRSDLRLNAYGCEELTEEDFVEVYPMLPGYVDLVLGITTALRRSRSRMQGDDHAIRGLLQLLGEIFRTQGLADGEVGQLVSLDAVFEVQHSALDPDVQSTLARIFENNAVRAEPLLARAAKAVALLENIQEENKPTTAELVAKVLYERIGQGNLLSAVSDALEKLRAENLVGYSEKHGYKIQSSAGQEWAREREDIGISNERVSELVQEKLKELVAVPERPKLNGLPFPWMAWFSDARRTSDMRLVDPRTEAAMAVDFRFVPEGERKSTEWVRLSDEGATRNRLLWVCGDHHAADGLARELGKSEAMLKRWKDRAHSLSPAKQKLVIEEQGREETLRGKLRTDLERAFMTGKLYFRGRELEPREQGAAFSTGLLAVGNRVLPELFPSFTDIAVTNAEFEQLLAPVLAGPSAKFCERGLGILTLDAGRHVPTCDGQVPSGILRFIEAEKGVSGSILLSNFGRPPYGYPIDVVRACVAGLLRAGKIRIRPQSGTPITSIRDEGVRDVFADRGLRLSELFLTENAPVTPRDRIAIRAFFKKSLSVDVEAENDAIADAVYAQFPGRRDRLRELEGKFARLPGKPQPPPALDKLAKALEDCRRSRQVEETVVEVKKNLDALRDGIEQLGMLQSDLTDEAIAQVSEAVQVRDHQLHQLEQVDALSDSETLKADAAAVRAHLATDRAWREVRSLEAALGRIREAYVLCRRRNLAEQAALAEGVRHTVKARPGFSTLTADQSHQVLRPLTEALFETTAEAVAPGLADLRDRFHGRLENAKEASNERLDEILSQKSEKPVVRVAANLSGREIASEEQLSAVLDELETRVREALDRGARVRLV